MTKMTGPEFRAALDKRAISQRGFARMTGAGPLAVNRWATGKRPVPFWVRPYLFLLDFLCAKTGKFPPDADEL